MTIRVFLVDDHTLMREGLRALLATTPDIAVVGDAGNGREALRRLDALDPDVVIMDIAMPELNGVEAAHLIRERFPAIRLIMLSMHSTAEYVYRALKAGAAGYLLKESAAGEVLAAVRAVHQGKRYLSPPVEQLVRASDASSAPSASPIDSLSTRERQVLQLVVEGKSSSEIARMINLSPKSVDTYRSRLMNKLLVNDVPSLVKFALAHGLTHPT